VYFCWQNNGSAPPSSTHNVTINGQNVTRTNFLAIQWLGEMYEFGELNRTSHFLVYGCDREVALFFMIVK